MPRSPRQSPRAAHPGAAARDVRIESVIHGGHGLARIDGQVCFVPGALPGDVVDLCDIVKQKGVLWGRIERLVAPAPDRVAAGCPVFGLCGGCTWLHFAYPAQGEWKRRIVAESFRRLARLDVHVDLAEDARHRLHYRTRARFHCDNGRWGFFAEESHDVVDIVACPLLHDTLNAAFATLRSLPIGGSVELAANPETGETMAWTRESTGALESAFEHVNTPRDNDRHAFLFDGVPVVNGAFSQSSLILNRLLVSTVRNAIPTGGHVLDLYCGSGNFSLNLPAECAVTGIDHSQAAIAAANAVRPGAYLHGNERAMTAALQSNDGDTIILDPPRTGAKAVMGAVAASTASRIVYVSCDPATLARDVAVLAAAGWYPDRVTAIDMYPNTWHVETVCELVRT